MSRSHRVNAHLRHLDTSGLACRRWKKAKRACVFFCCLYDADTFAFPEKVIPWAFIPFFTLHLGTIFHLLRPRNRSCVTPPPCASA
ncbi:hypothetical protein GOODEAATRI_002254 [Goodea atripinnis]|uniref:Uncharacterized protein n=1 Tax=Goodea atripinnis TaxID=208336 RepID=A0ABV0MNP3_9TELE